MHELTVNLTKGEITPLAQARVDIDLWKSSAARVRNWTTLKYGGVRRRSGTSYIGSVKSHAAGAEFIPFIFSQSQAYALEMGENYTRFWTPAGQVLDSGTPYEIVSPYTRAQVERVQWVQANDVMYMVHPDLAPRVLTRSGLTSWAYSTADIQDGPYLPINDTSATITVSVAAANGGSTSTLTFSAITNVNRGLGFQSGDVGRHFRALFSGGTWGWGKITEVTSTSVIKVLWVVGATNGSTSASTATWRLGAFSDYAGWPGSVAFFEGRLAFGRTTLYPRSVAFSRSNLPLTFTPSATDGTVADDHGMWYDIVGGQADEILWLAEAPRLQIGTASVIRSIGAADVSDTMTPRNLSAKREINSGTEAIPPLQIGPSTVHVGRYHRTLHDLFYNYEVNSLVSPNITLLSEHMFPSGIRRLATTVVPEGILWAVTNDGLLAGCTFEKNEQVSGWHAHPMTNGEVETICALPDPTSKRDVLMMVVKRTIAGETKRYVEILNKPFDTNDGDTLTSAIFSDCSATYDGAAANTISGLDHLEGQEVDILADGFVIPRQIVSNGEIRLPNDRTASVITIGLPIATELTLLRKATASPEEGPTLGLRKRVVHVITDLFESLGVFIGPLGGQAEALTRRVTNIPMGQTLDLETGTKPVGLEDDWSPDGQITVLTPYPLPATIRGLNLSLELGS